MAHHKLPMAWLCEMKNSILGLNGELLEYCHLIATPQHVPHGPNLMETKLDNSHRAHARMEHGNKHNPLHTMEQGTMRACKNVTYGLITCLIRPEKVDEPNHTWLVASGDRVHYPSDAGTPTANLLIMEFLINSIILTLGAKFITMDVKDFYLSTPIARYKYMTATPLTFLNQRPKSTLEATCS